MADRYAEARALCRRPMTVEKARLVVEAIREISGDEECAHALEDRLREVVLEYLADGAAVDREDAEDSAELARVALSTRDIEFARYCA